MAELRWEGLSAGCGLLVGSELFPLCHAHLSASGGHRFSLRSELKLWSEIGKGGKKKKKRVLCSVSVRNCTGVGGEMSAGGGGFPIGKRAVWDTVRLSCVGSLLRPAFHHYKGG